MKVSICLASEIRNLYYGGEVLSEIEMEQQGRAGVEIGSDLCQLI